jgi:hypothetical protein
LPRVSEKNRTYSVFLPVSRSSADPSLRPLSGLVLSVLANRHGVPAQTELPTPTLFTAQLRFCYPFSLRTGGIRLSPRLPAFCCPSVTRSPQCPLSSGYSPPGIAFCARRLSPRLPAFCCLSVTCSPQCPLSSGYSPPGIAFCARRLPSPGIAFFSTCRPPHAPLPDAVSCPWRAEQFFFPVVEPQY